jgi:hypothetical protein
MEEGIMFWGLVSLRAIVVDRIRNLATEKTASWSEKIEFHFLRVMNFLEESILNENGITPGQTHQLSKTFSK